MPAATSSAAPTILSIAFNRNANALLLTIVLLSAWTLLPFYALICLIVAIVVFFVVGVTPAARRNRDAWNEYFPRQQVERVQMADFSHWREWQLPMLVIVHSEAPFSVSSLQFWNHEAFDNSTLCVSFPARTFPLARYVLWKLGGILPATRSVLLRLLGRRDNSGGSAETGGAATASTSAGASSVPSSVVVAFYDGSRLKVGDKTVEGELATKSVVSAALMTAANVAPAVQLSDGTIWVGKPRPLLSGGGGSNNAAAAAAASSSSSNGSGTLAAKELAKDAVDGPIEAPSTEQVLAASDEYCNALASVLRKAYPDKEVKMIR